jgi:hypothetical protein
MFTQDMLHRRDCDGMDYVDGINSIRTTRQLQAITVKWEHFIIFHPTQLYFYFKGESMEKKLNIFFF